jgi:hypothetical protein
MLDVFCVSVYYFVVLEALTWASPLSMGSPHLFIYLGWLKGDAKNSHYIVKQKHEQPVMNWKA